MLKLVMVFIIMFFCSVCVEARIIVECNNFTDTVSYRSYKNVGVIGIREYSIIKEIDADEKSNYYLRLVVNFTNHSSQGSRYLLGKNVDFEIDGVVYKASKAINERLPKSSRLVNAFDNCYYKIPDECMNAIAKTKGRVKFTTYIPNKKPDIIFFNDGNLSEVKNMVENAHFANYLENINLNNEKYSQKTIQD